MGLLGLVLFSRPAQAEWYVGGQVGANLPADLSDVQWSAGGASVSGNDLELQTSLVYGGKVGYYFESVKWLGIETEVFNATPHIKQQNYTIGGFNFRCRNRGQRQRYRGEVRPRCERPRLPLKHANYGR